MDSLTNTELLELIIIGCFGSMAVEIVTLVKYTVNKTIPSFYYNWIYWLLRILLVFTAGGLVYVYVRSGITINPIIALNIGASVPLIIEKLSQEPQIPDYSEYGQ